MDELERARRRLEKHREELEAAKEELAALEPLKASLGEEVDRQIGELFSFAEERGHAWVRREESAGVVRWALSGTLYHDAVSDEGTPIPKAEEKVRRLEGKVKWWENKVWKLGRDALLAKHRKEG